MKKRAKEPTINEWRAFFEHPGWSTFKQHVEDSIDSVNQALRIAEGTDFYVTQGVARTLDDISGFEDQVMRTETIPEGPEPTDKEYSIDY